MLNSDFRRLGAVNFPRFLGRQEYMHTFDAANPKMCEGCWEYFYPVIALLGKAGVTKGAVHMTVDEKIVPAGMSQRRPKPHVDGCFIPAKNRWGGGGGWLHTCNDLGLDFPLQRMAIIVASTVEGCRAWRGDFDTMPKDDGDVSHIEDQLGEGEILPANAGFLLSPDCIHESLIFPQPTKRQFLRLAFAI
jgi:hypothetical protein